MALLSTGTSTPLEDGLDVDATQRPRSCYRGGSPCGTSTDPLELLDSLTFDSSEGGVSLEEGLNLLEGTDYSCFGGSVSPQYSPFSEYSSGAESGYTSCGVMSPFQDGQRFVENLMRGGPEDSIPKAEDKLTKVQLEKNKKNAEAARQNRIKKKKYMEDLEKERSVLKTENVVLKTRCREYQTKMTKLQEEVQYLRSVLANDSVLASLITNIPKVPDVKLTSSFRKRPNESVESNNCSKKVKIQATKGGICLHVSKDVVSLELCQHCSKQASQS